ncbi:MAG: hypothetical protein GTN64_05635 [Candidatus Latescibacteria bacterium]|nr:hypothetical protein [Candidatus Latescibacterota bacterium]NIO78091.1 hypothetical protein [Candidatus Latescibacterota bacterium]
MVQVTIDYTRLVWLEQLEQLIEEIHAKNVTRDPVDQAFFCGYVSGAADRLIKCRPDGEAAAVKTEQK